MFCLKVRSLNDWIMGQLTLTNYHIKHDKITMSFFFTKSELLLQIETDADALLNTVIKNYTLNWVSLNNVSYKNTEWACYFDISSISYTSCLITGLKRHGISFRSNPDLILQCDIFVQLYSYCITGMNVLFNSEIFYL